jgi:membrane associated rhomboid family serine protease
MIPIRDVIPSRTTPVVTIGLIAVNAVMFAYASWLPDRTREAFLRSFGLVPADFSWALVFTSMFLHGGLLHFGGNMLYLWIFGDNVEDRVGHGRFIVFYLLCGCAAALAQAAMARASGPPVIGASGAIAGVMGAYFLLFPNARVVTLVPLLLVVRVVEVPAILFLGIWFVFQLLSGAGSVAGAAASYGALAIWSHAAGFAAGACAVIVFRRPERERVEWWSDR